jgi:predicted  nucleic acid-binding Zn-ribbon protein
MATQADPDELARLLELQAEDSALRRLEQRRATLPEARRLAELQDSLSELGSDLDIARKQRQELAREQDRLEGEIGIGDRKIAREEQRLFSGAVSNPRELSSLQAEVEMLKRKRGELEDALLEVMMQREHATATETSLDAERSSVASEAEVVSDAVAAITDEIDGELRQRSAPTSSRSTRRCETPRVAWARPGSRTAPARGATPSCRRERSRGSRPRPEPCTAATTAGASWSCCDAPARRAEARPRANAPRWRWIADSGRRRPRWRWTSGRRAGGRRRSVERTGRMQRR